LTAAKVPKEKTLLWRRSSKLPWQRVTDLVSHFSTIFGGVFNKLMYWLGPTCKKMMDLKSADKVFKSAAFEPTDEELREHTRSKWRIKKEKTGRHDIKMRSPSPVRSISPTSSIPDIFDDSDDDLPDVAHMLDTPPKKRKEKEKIRRNMIEVGISKFLTSRTFFILNDFLSGV
jgi:hypothetical protein